MDDEHLKGIIIVLICALTGLFLGTVIAASLKGTVERATKEYSTNAKPIYQQRIGDEAEPDILIIYEAEVDGVKVYPSVIKEAK